MILLKNKSLIKFFLFVTLLILLIGFCSSATVESNDTTKILQKQDLDSSKSVVEVTKKESEVTNDVILIEDDYDQTKPTPTRIGINRINTTSFTDNVSISGKFTDITGRNLIKTPLKININGKNFTTKTDTEGYYSYDFKTNAIGKNNVTVSYHGNLNFAATSSNITFNVIAQSTNMTIYDIEDVGLNEEVTISGRYLDKNGVFLIRTPLKISFNGQAYTTKTNDSGEFTFKVKTTQVGVNNVSVAYPGNIRYSGDVDTATFYVKQPTKMYINAIKDTVYSEVVTITGKYTDTNGRLLIRTPLNVNLNGLNYTTKTNDSGEFTFKVKTTQVGLNNVRVSYPGNKRFSGAAATKTFNVVPCNTVMSIDKIQDVAYSDVVSITGKYTDKNGIILTWTPLNVKLNNLTYTTKTDSKGSFALDIVTDTVGVNNVSVSYPGNRRYNGAVDTTSFNVTRKNTKLYLDKIRDVNYSDIVSISGKYTDNTGRLLIRTPLNINFNGFTYTTKTNDSGKFILDIQTYKIGENKVSVSYPGNKRYNGAEATTTFFVIGESDILSIDTIPTTQYTDTVKITGKYTDKYGKTFGNVALTININGINYTTKTDSSGYYTLNYKTNTIGVNNVSVSYYANNTYPALTNMINFNVTRKDTRLSLETIPNSTLGSKITIKGKYTDSSGNPLKLTTVSLLINDVRYPAKTDENGNFKCDYETFVSGKNSLEAYYGGTERYAGTSLNATFNVSTPISAKIFKTRKTMVASVFVSGSIDSSHITKWVNSGITDVYVMAKAYNNDTALLRQTISLCKNTNIKVHAWVIVFRENKKWDNSVSNQNKMKKFLTEVMHINGVEGVCLDYIRYSGTNPSIVNTSVITNFLKDVNYIAKNIDQRMEVAACVMPEITNLKYYYGQDLKAMEKYVDYMIVMAYKNNYYKDTAWMVEVTQSLLKQVKHAKVVTSLTTYSDMYGKNYLSIQEITSDIKAILKAGSYGYSLFSKSTTPVYPKIF